MCLDIARGRRFLFATAGRLRPLRRYLLLGGELLLLIDSLLSSIRVAMCVLHLPIGGAMEMIHHPVDVLMSRIHRTISNRLRMIGQVL